MSEFEQFQSKLIERSKMFDGQINYPYITGYLLSLLSRSGIKIEPHSKYLDELIEGSVIDNALQNSEHQESACETY